MRTFDVPRLGANDPAIKLGAISICGYGPSLAETWRDTLGAIMTTSGAHDFMVARGVMPKYQVRMLTNPQQGVTYLLNSQCHPTFFERLAGYKVIMWHSFTSDDADRQIALVDAIEPGTRLLAGGTNVGTRAAVVARELGHTHFELHGMDCCYRDTQWAGPHLGRPHDTVRVEVEGVEFETSDLMMQGTDDWFTVMRMMPGCLFRAHGDGLLEARIKLLNRDSKKALSKEWWRPVNFALRAA
jgi:hypothetical protein